MTTPTIEEWIDDNMPRRADGEGDKWHTREEVVDAITSLTEQHQREKERLVKEIINTGKDIVLDSDYILVSDIEEIAKKHNIQL